MIINVDETGLGKTKNITQERLTVPEIFFDEFHNSITIENTKNLYKKFKTIEIKGYITHDKFIESMKEIFDDLIKNKIINLYNENKIRKIDFKMNQTIEGYVHEIYELYFLRFREIKCILKNNKTIFYLTDFIPENHINTYNIICSLVVLMKSPFNRKIKLLFQLSDVDEDGFLNEMEIRHMITTCNFLFCEERNGLSMNSTIISQSLMNIKVNEILKQICAENKTIRDCAKTELKRMNLNISEEYIEDNMISEIYIEIINSIIDEKKATTSKVEIQESEIHMTNIGISTISRLDTEEITTSKLDNKKPITSELSSEESTT